MRRIDLLWLDMAERNPVVAQDAAAVGHASARRFQRGVDVFGSFIAGVGRTLLSAGLGVGVIVLLRARKKQRQSQKRRTGVSALQFIWKGL